VRLKLDNPKLASVRNMLELGFESPLPHQEILSRAWADKALQSYFKPVNAPYLGQLLQKTAVDAFAQIQGRVGINVGIPIDTVSDFAKTIAADALEDGEVNWANFALSGAKAVTDIALDAMEAVPIIGWAAKLAWGIVSAIMALASSNAPRPLLLTYSKETDDFEANRAINMIGNLHNPEFRDWTNLFMPGAEGDWKAIKAENGYVVGPKEGTDGLGSMPPAAFGSRVIQVNNWAAIAEALQSELYKPKSPAHKDPLLSASVRKAINASSEDVWSQLPSVQRVCSAAWNATTTNRTASIWSINPYRVRTAWWDYVKRGMYWATHQSEFNSTLYSIGLAVRHRLSMAPVAVTIPKGYLPPGVNPNRMRLDYISTAWCEFVAKRQLDMCLTKACAYASEDQAIFVANSGVKERLMQGRIMLLHTFDAESIALEDVIDGEYRLALRDYKGPRSGSMPGTPQRTPAPASPKLDLVGHGGGGGGLAIGAGLAIALGAAWAFTRK
jgi:hypothetical protein